MTVETNVIVEQPIHKGKAINVYIYIFALLAVIGAVSWFLQMRDGFILTNLSTLNMWGLYVSGFMIFTGVAAGSLIFAAIPHLFNLEDFKPYTRIAAFLAAISTIVAGLFITADIGNPQRAWLFITNGNFSSPMFWDFIVLSTYMVLSIIFIRQLLLVADKKKQDHTLKPIALISFVAGILVVVTSFVFSFQVARPLWNTPMQSLSFLIAALVAALAVLIIVLTVLNKYGYTNMPINLLSIMGKTAAALLCVELILVLSEVFIGIYTGAGHEYHTIQWLVLGNGAMGFWLQIFFMATAVIILAMGKSQRAGGLLVGAIAAIVAVYLIKSNFLQTELFNPTLDLPGPILYGDITGSYLPSLLEVGLAVGIISFGICLLLLGVRKMNFGVSVNK
jgi:Ni/Fe-hydrogenase subunit HybB-like protein